MRAAACICRYFSLQIIFSTAGLFLGVLIFLVCANYTASPAPDTVSPAAVAASKRVLVHAASGKRLHNYAGSETRHNQARVTSLNKGLVGSRLPRTIQD